VKYCVDGVGMGTSFWMQGMGMNCRSRVTLYGTQLQSKRLPE